MHHQIQVIKFEDILIISIYKFHLKVYSNNNSTVTKKCKCNDLMFKVQSFTPESFTREVFGSPFVTIQQDSCSEGQSVFSGIGEHVLNYTTRLLNSNWAFIMKFKSKFKI